MRTWLLILAILSVGSTSACSMLTRPIDATSINACRAGTTCVVSGELRLHQGQPAWAALVVAGDQCAKLALPDDFYVAAKQWNGSAVEATGQAFRQPDFDEGGGMVTLWYTERGRKLSLGMCDGGVAIYVDSIRSRNGKSWPLEDGPGTPTSP